MTTALVTGADGFIGCHLVDALSAGDTVVHRHSKRDGDVSDEETWRRLPSADVLIHLAAQSGVLKSWEAPTDFVRSNCLGVARALEYSRRHRSKMILISSYLYGDSGSTALAETAPIEIRNPYALTKRFSEQLCGLYIEQHGVDVRILRPFNVYGPRQSREFLIPMLIHQAVKHGRVVVNDLEPRRDFLHVDDLVAAIIKSIHYTGPHQVFNIGTGRSHSVLDVIRILETHLGHHLEVINQGRRRPGEIMDTVADVTLARRELGWEPTLSLVDGLSRMIK